MLDVLILDYRQLNVTWLSLSMIHGDDVIEIMSHYFRYFDTRHHNHRTRHTSFNEALPKVGTGSSNQETPSTIPALPNEDSRKLLQQNGK